MGRNTGRQSGRDSGWAGFFGLGWLVLLATAPLTAAAHEAAAHEPAVLVLNDTNEPPYTTQAGDGFLDIVVGEMFRRAGVQLRLIKIPSERALINVNDGIDDGDLTRIAGLEQQYPNLIRVPEKLMQWEFAAFCKRCPRSSSWDALRRHAVGHVKGWKIYEQNMAGAERVTTAVDPDQLFRLLALDRIEVALYERWIGLAYLKEHGITGVQVLLPPLVSREMYIYLHKRHAALVPKLARALRALKHEGFYARVYRQKIEPYRAANTW